MFNFKFLIVEKRDQAANQVFHILSSKFDGFVSYFRGYVYCDSSF